MIKVTVEEAQNKLEELIKVVENGEEVFIVANNGKTFQIIQVEKSQKQFREFGTAKGMFSMSNDFDEPLEDFKDYMP